MGDASQLVKWLISDRKAPCRDVKHLTHVGDIVTCFSPPEWNHPSSSHIQQGPGEVGGGQGGGGGN